MGEIEDLRKKEHHFSDIMMIVQAIKIEEKEAMFYGTKFSTYEMDVQIPHSICTKVSKKNNIF